MKICVDCKWCSQLHLKCRRKDKKTGFPINSSIDYQRSFSFLTDKCGITGKYFEPLHPIPKIDYKRFEELSKFLHNHIDAYSYHTGIGFENALGDYEVDETLWDKCVLEINEFEDIVSRYAEQSCCDIVIVYMENFKVSGYKKVIG